MKINEISKLNKDLNPLNEIENSNDFYLNSPKLKNKPKTFLIRKLNECEVSDEKFEKEFKNYFYNPTTYFSINSPLRIGKKQEITEISLEIKNNKKLLNKRNILNISNVSRKRSTITKLSKEKDKFSVIDNTKFELIDNKRLNNIFNIYKERINSSKKNNSYFKYKRNLPLNISLPLNNQEKNLLNQRYFNRQNEHLMNYLSKKIQEKKEGLLMNNIDNFLYKKEAIRKIENKNKLNEISDRYKWTTSLRNSGKIKGIRKTLVNINSDKNPFWAFLIEKSPNMKQTAIRPGINLDDRNLQNFIKKTKSFEQTDELNNLEKINIKGKNLFNIEYNREMSSKRKKILHKAFIENGKVISNAEINNMFGKQTFYKNYEKNMRNYSPFIKTSLHKKNLFIN